MASRAFNLVFWGKLGCFEFPIVSLDIPRCRSEVEASEVVILNALEDPSRHRYGYRLLILFWYCSHSCNLFVPCSRRNRPIPSSLCGWVMSSGTPKWMGLSLSEWQKLACFNFHMHKLVLPMLFYNVKTRYCGTWQQLTGLYSLVLYRLRIE